MNNIIRQITSQLPCSPGPLALIRSKQGVHVFRCKYEGRPAVIKYFEHEGDRREIGYYRLFHEIGVPTMKVYALTERCIVMEDISFSDTWRLGEEKDMTCPSVLRALAGWYFALHEGGEDHISLAGMYSENDELNEKAIAALREYLPGAEPLCLFTETHLSEFGSLLRRYENSLTYNDFYYTNLLVRMDGSAAMMFDYNCLGRGYRYADFRNIASSVAEDAFAAFAETYSALHCRKYGTRFATSKEEKQLDDFLSPLLGLVSALRRERFPAWAEPFREAALSGALLKKGKEIIDHA